MAPAGRGAMIVEIASAIVLILGVVVGVLSVWGLLDPARLIALVRRVAEGPGGVAVAVLVRIVLGGALIVAAPSSRFPLAFAVLGWIAIAAAIVLLRVRKEGMLRIVGWVERWSAASARAWLVGGLAFAAFLIVGES